MQHPKADDEQRLRFQARVQKYRDEGCEIIYVDESGFAKDMPRCLGYSIRGKRCYGKQDWQARGRTNVIGALLNNILMTICTFQSTIDSEVFNTWVTQDLLPKTSPGTIIIMDNASFHKKEATKRAIELAGCTLEFLPTYSPDLNPIAHKWAQAKAIRRKLRCSVDEIFQQTFFDIKIKLSSSTSPFKASGVDVVNPWDVKFIRM